MGAWIETFGIEGLANVVKVAPRVGAWIETSFNTQAQRKLLESHPVWVRGLKRLACNIFLRCIVSHPVWVRGLKPTFGFYGFVEWQSHPVWVRGLKHN